MPAIFLNWSKMLAKVKLDNSILALQVPAGLHPLISLVLRSYREMYPAVQTKLEEAGSQKQLDWLISEKLDIAF